MNHTNDESMMIIALLMISYGFPIRSFPSSCAAQLLPSSCCLARAPARGSPRGWPMRDFRALVTAVRSADGGPVTAGCHQRCNGGSRWPFQCLILAINYAILRWLMVSSWLIMVDASLMIMLISMLDNDSLAVDNG